MSGETVNKTAEEMAKDAQEADKAMLPKVAPQIFKRNGDVKRCPRKLTIKKTFLEMLADYNRVKESVTQNAKYMQEPTISFCAKGVSVTLTGDLAQVIVFHPSDILAKVIDAGWIIC